MSGVNYLQHNMLQFYRLISAQGLESLFPKSGIQLIPSNSTVWVQNVRTL